MDANDLGFVHIRLVLPPVYVRSLICVLRHRVSSPSVALFDRRDVTRPASAGASQYAVQLEKNNF